MRLVLFARVLFVRVGWGCEDFAGFFYFYGYFYDYVYGGIFHGLRSLPCSLLAVGVVLLWWCCGILWLCVCVDGLLGGLFEVMDSFFVLAGLVSVSEDGAAGDEDSGTCGDDIANSLEIDSPVYGEVDFAVRLIDGVAQFVDSGE